MRFLRHSAVQRAFSAVLVLGLGLWMAAPALGASTQRTIDADWLGAAPPTVEAAFADALNEAAARGAQTPDAFVAAFTDVLAAQADPDLARFLEAHPPEALLSVLYGQWMRALSHHRGLEAAPAPPTAAPTASSALALALALRSTDRTAPHDTGAALPTQDVPPVPLAERFSAQPLGP